MIVKSAVLPGITVVLYSATNQSCQVYRTRQMDQPDKDNSYEDMNCKCLSHTQHIQKALMMKTLGPVAPCGSATIDGVNLYYTSAHMHPPFFPPFPVCMHMCKCTHAPCIPMCMYTHMENECTLLLGDHQVS